MASICFSVSFPSVAKSPNSNRPFHFPPKSCNLNPFSRPMSTARTSKTRATSSATLREDGPETSEESMSINNLHRFFDLNLGKWTGSFYQFDGNGNLLQKVNTKLSVSSYGEDELISLIQSLYIQQPPSGTSISGHYEEPEWVEYKIKETNMFTVDRYQQSADWLFSE